MQRRRSNRSPHRLKIEFPIDQCLLTAGSFIHDFRTPSAPETLQVSRLSAITILAEIGRDLSRFPTAGHLVSWAGLCPAQNESAGKRKSSRLRKGAPWLKTMLVQCAWAARRKKNSYYAAQFNRLKSRRGPQKAICAVAASILTAIYHMLINGTPHHDLGVDYFDRRSPETKARRRLAQLHRLGFAVKLQPLAEAA
jgi:transposase